MNGSNHYDLVFLGAYTKDTIVSPGGTRTVDGGGFNYGANIAVRLGFQVAAVTRLAAADFHLVAQLREAGVTVYPHIAPHSTCITLEYPTADLDQRTICVTTTSGSFTTDEVRDLAAAAFVVSPSIRGEVPLAVIDEIKRNNRNISIDVQGYIRVIGENGLLQSATWPEKEAVLASADVLKADAVEAEFLTGVSNLRHAAQKLAGWGPREIVLTHRDGLLVYDGKQFYEAGFYPRCLIGRSGRGDTVIGAYMAKRLTDSPAAAAIWAAAAVSIKMEAEGPFKRDIREIEQLIQEKYQVKKQ